MRGRPGKLTPESQSKIEKAISLGATYAAAAAAGGVAYNTFNEWMKKGAIAKSGQYHDFYETVKKAESDAQVRWLAQIEKASQSGTWQAAAWKLERRYPDDFGRQIVRNEHTGEGGNAFKVIVEYANDDRHDPESA